MNKQAGCHISSFLYSVIPFIVGLLPAIFVIPLFLNYLGAEQLGVYYLFIAVVGIGGATDFGLSQTVTRFFASKEHGPAFRSKVFQTVLAVYLAFAMVIIGAILSLVAFGFFEHVSTLLILFAVGVSVQFFFLFVLSLLRGLSRFKSIAKIEVFHKISFVSIGLVGIIFLPKVEVLLLVYTAVSLSVVLYYFVLYSPNYLMRRSLTVKGLLVFFRQTLFPYSKWIFAQNLSGFFYVSLDKFLVAGLIGLKELAAYNIALSLSRLFPTAFYKGGSYLLTFFASKEKLSAEEFKNVYFSTNLKISLALSVVMLLVLFFAPVLISYYLKSDLSLATNVSDLFPFLLVCGIFDAVHVFNFNLFNARGDVKVISILKIFVDSIIVLSVIAGVLIFGLQGVLFGKLTVVVGVLFFYSILGKTSVGENRYILSTIRMFLPLLLSVLVLFLYVYLIR